MKYSIKCLEEQAKVLYAEMQKFDPLPVDPSKSDPYYTELAIEYGRIKTEIHVRKKNSVEYI